MDKRVTKFIAAALVFSAGAGFVYFFQAIARLLTPMAQFAARLVSLQLW